MQAINCQMIVSLTYNCHYLSVVQIPSLVTGKAGGVNNPTISPGSDRYACVACVPGREICLVLVSDYKEGRGGRIT